MRWKADITFYMASACKNGQKFPILMLGTVSYGGWIVSKVQSVFWRRVTSLRRGWFELEGVLFCWRIPVFVEECVLISRRGSSASGVGGHTSLGRGAFDLEEGVYITWSRGGGSHTFAGGSRRGVF